MPIEDYCEENPSTQGCPISKNLTTEPSTAAPVACCMAMTAECLACSSGKPVKEYCKENPSAQGCPTPLPTPAPAPLPTPDTMSKFVQPECRPIWLNYCEERHCSSSNILHTYCEHCPVCSGSGHSLTPTTPQSCSEICDRPSDCTNYPSICSGCSFCDEGSPSTEPSPSAVAGGHCSVVCDRRS